MNADEKKGISYYNALAVQAQQDTKAFSELYEYFSRGCIIFCFPV